jgi:predicted phosphodiesterase
VPVSLRRPLGFLSLLLAAGLLAGCAGAGSVTFVAMGCGPYTAADAEALPGLLARENARGGAAFMVHCGDIVSGERAERAEEEYALVARLLHDGNSTPTFIVPGDNEWNDLDDPDAGWANWERHFLGFHQRWEHPFDVERQTGRTENFAFLHEGVLFVGLNVVGGHVHDPDEWSRRLDDDAAWLVAQVAARGDGARALVVFAQASPNVFDGRLLQPLRQVAREFARPVLYLHADGHSWLVERGEWEPNLTRVQLDKLTPETPPIRVTITDDPSIPFLFDRRFPPRRVPNRG